MGKDISVTVDGLRFPNPFVIGSGPPGTNKATCCRAFKEGWGGVVIKTISLDGSKVHNVAPRYGKLYSRENKEVIGFQNIELISDRPFEAWLTDIAAIKKEYPDRILIGSIMEEYDKDRWIELTKQTVEAGCDALEINFSCPHGMPERKMGQAMGQNPDIVREVTSWVKSATNVPVWAKMTPNITNISVPSVEALKGGADGISLINTVLGIIGIDTETLRPMPTVKGYSIPGGYSAQAVRPIALRHVLDLIQGAESEGFSRDKYSISGIGGVENAKDAIEFILMGSHTVQSCTGPMLQGFKMVKEMISGLEDFMTKHGFNSVEEFRGKSLEYFTTHAHLVELKQGKFEKKEVAKDEDWSGEKLADQTSDMTTN